MSARKAKAKSVPKLVNDKDYSPEEREAIIQHICEEIAKKRSVFRILEEDEGMPRYATLMRWRAQSETVREQLTQAREDALEAVIEEIIEISDDAKHDAYLKHDKNGKPYAAIDGDCVQRAKLRVYAREKVAQMLAPRRFGVQRMDVTSGGEKISNETNVTLVENRVASILMVAQRRIEEQKQLEQIIDVDLD